MVKQKQKQSQKVVVNINTAKAKGKRKRKAKPKKALPQYVKYPNSIGYALNNQMYQMSQPKMIDYNLGLAQANILREQQMRTGSLIPNQQINSLTPIATAVAYSVESTNNQVNMLDPTEGLVEEVVEAQTTDAYDASMYDRVAKKIAKYESDISERDDIISRQDEFIVTQFNRDLDARNLGERERQAIAPALVAPEVESAFAQSDNRKMTPQEYEQYQNEEEEMQDITPRKRKPGGGRKPGSKNKPKDLGEVVKRPSTPPFEI